MKTFKNVNTNRSNAFITFISPTLTRSISFFKSLFSKKTINKISEQLFNPDQSDELKAFSAAFGIFIGIIPIWGFQTLAAICLSVVLKLNKVLVILFSQVSFPLTFPLIIGLSYKIGGYWINKPNNVSSGLDFHNLNQHLTQYLYGSFTLAILAALTVGPITFLLLKLIKSIKQSKSDIANKPVTSTGV